MAVVMSMKLHPAVGAALTVALLLFAVSLIQRMRKTQQWPTVLPTALPTIFKAGPQMSDIDPTAAIEPLSSFDLWNTEPTPFRPYEFQGHVTMGIRQSGRQDWIAIDRGYTARLQQRRELLDREAQYTIGTGPLVNGAIEELYEEIMIDYLPKRYPTLFEKRKDIVFNRVTGEIYPLSTRGLSHETMLRLMGHHVEEDFYFMCPDDVDGQFRLRGYVACFPGGFLSPARVGESVREIHQPVPGFEEKLGKSVDRYFSRMVPGNFIQRMNWSLQTDGIDLFRIDGNNFYPGQEADPEKHREKYDPLLDQVYLRVERQTLCQLPKSRAIIFCVRSYMTPVVQMREQGEGPALAAAIESMPEKLGEYKMRHLWGEKILPWLRDGPNGRTHALHAKARSG